MKRYCDIRSVLLKNIKTFRGTNYFLRKKFIFKLFLHWDGSSFISSSTSTILSYSEVEETHNSFQNPESFIDEFDNTDDNDKVQRVHVELLPENEYEIEGNYFDSCNDILCKSSLPSYSNEISQSFSESC